MSCRFSRLDTAVQVGAASNSHNLLCCSQLQFSCISWVRRSRRGLQRACALVVNTMQFSACICRYTLRSRQIVSLSVYDPQGQQPTAAPVPLSEALNDLSKQRLQNLAKREGCFIYRLHKWILCGKFWENVPNGLNIENLRRHAALFLSLFNISSTAPLCRRGTDASFFSQVAPFFACMF